MRDTGPINKALDGDTEAAAAAIGISRVQLGVLRNYMRFAGLQQGQRTITLPDGTVINAWVNHAQAGVRIMAPSGAMMTEQAPEGQSEWTPPSLAPTRGGYRLVIGMNGHDWPYLVPNNINGEVLTDPTVTKWFNTGRDAPVKWNPPEQNAGTGVNIPWFASNTWIAVLDSADRPLAENQPHKWAFFGADNFDMVNGPWPPRGRTSPYTNRVLLAYSIYGASILSLPPGPLLPTTIRMVGSGADSGIPDVEGFIELPNLLTALYTLPANVGGINATTELGGVPYPMTFMVNGQNVTNSLNDGVDISKIIRLDMKNPRVDVSVEFYWDSLSLQPPGTPSWTNYCLFCVLPPAAAETPSPIDLPWMSDGVVSWTGAPVGVGTTTQSMGPLTLSDFYGNNVIVPTTFTTIVHRLR